MRKGRNIIERLDPSLHAGVKKVLRQAWDSPTAEQAERVLRNLARRHDHRDYPRALWLRHRLKVVFSKLAAGLWIDGRYSIGFILESSDRSSLKKPFLVPGALVRSYKLVWVASLVALSILLSGCGARNSHKNTQRPPPDVGVVTVHATAVTLTTELPGRTSPFAISDLRPQVNGIIQNVLFEQGSEVKAGQTLYQIDPALYQAAFDNAKATLASAQANLKSAKALAERDAQLVKTNAISRQDYDTAEAAYEQAQAAIQQQQANLETARINLAYTKVTAPIGGRAGISTVTKGALVTANQTTALTTVQTLDPMYVDIAQSSTQLLALRQEIARGSVEGSTPAAAEVSLTLPDGSRYPLKGKLQFTDITVDPNTGAVILRALFPNPEHLLLPGLFVRATVVEGVDPRALLVPQQGVIRDVKNKPTAWVVGKDDKVELRDLKVSRAIGNKWLVTSGIKDGDRIIVQGTQKVRPGMTVHPVPISLDGGPKTASTSATGR